MQSLPDWPELVSFHLQKKKNERKVMLLFYYHIEGVHSVFPHSKLFDLNEGAVVYLSMGLY